MNAAFGTGASQDLWSGWLLLQDIKDVVVQVL